MKQSVFITLLIVIALGASAVVYFFIFGAENDRYGFEFIYKGGPLVIVLMTLSIMAITFVFERFFSLRKANGKGSITAFLRRVERHLTEGKIDAAIAECDKQRGSVANIIRSGLERYNQLSAENTLRGEKQMAEVQRSIEEAMMLETPLLEKNLIALSTIASVSVMFGLLGATIGMIRAFRALARHGAPDAIQLSIGISEALINTALGLIAAIVGIIAYNYFVNRVDNFTYMIDEASYNVIQILTQRSGK